MISRPGMGGERRHRVCGVAQRAGLSIGPLDLTTPTPTENNMTPIDNAILTEMLDNALSDIKYLRAEVSALREAKAEATAQA